MSTAWAQLRRFFVACKPCERSREPEMLFPVVNMLAHTNRSHSVLRLQAHTGDSHRKG